MRIGSVEQCCDGWIQTRGDEKVSRFATANSTERRDGVRLFSERRCRVKWMERVR